MRHPKDQQAASFWIPGEGSDWGLFLMSGPLLSLGPELGKKKPASLICTLVGYLFCFWLQPSCGSLADVFQKSKVMTSQHWNARQRHFLKIWNQFLKKWFDSQESLRWLIKMKTKQFQLDCNAMQVLRPTAILHKHSTGCTCSILQCIVLYHRSSVKACARHVLSWKNICCKG